MPISRNSIGQYGDYEQICTDAFIPECYGWTALELKQGRIYACCQAKHWQKTAKNGWCQTVNEALEGMK
jgi:hypothetical protein